jgi:hypothetical protein
MQTHWEEINFLRSSKAIVGLRWGATFYSWEHCGLAYTNHIEIHWTKDQGKKNTIGQKIKRGKSWIFVVVLVIRTFGSWMNVWPDLAFGGNSPVHACFKHSMIVWFLQTQNILDYGYCQQTPKVHHNNKTL